MPLNDIYHVWGNDLSAAANGDLLLTSGPMLTEQRILRRLMTNPGTPQKAGDYIFEPSYGAGIPSYVGSTSSADEIASVTKGQVLLEQAVAQNPAPRVTVGSMTNGVSETIQYTDNETGQPAVMSFNASL